MPLKCAYAFFARDITINATTNNMSVDEIFSYLTMAGPGTTKFNFVIGLWGIGKGKTAGADIKITAPSGIYGTGKWSTKGSKEEAQVHAVVFDGSSFPITEPGPYTFSVTDKTNGVEIASRILTVTFGEVGEAKYE